MSAESGSLLRRWRNDYPFFRHIRRRVILIVTAATVIPAAALAGAAFYNQYSYINEKAEQSLQNAATGLKDRIDLHLTGQLALLRLTAAFLEQAGETGSDGLKAALARLQDASPFLDLGIYDGQGRCLAGYPVSGRVPGPGDIPRPPGEPYGPECGFAEIRADSKGKALSYSAHCRFGGQGRCALWAVFAAGPILEILAGSGPDESFLVGPSGVFQSIKTPSPFPPVRDDSGERKAAPGRDYFEASAQLETVSWQCLVRRPRESVGRELERTRNMGLLLLIPLLALALAAIVLTVNYLVGKLESDHRLIKRMDRQIKRAGQLANSLHLSHGPIHELKTILVNLDSTAACLKETLEHPENQAEDVEVSFQKIREELGRGQSMVEKLHANIRTPALESIIKELDLNSLLTDLIDLLGLELYLNEIVVETFFQEDLPPILGDQAQIRQIFMNILLNAVSAVGSEGAITITTGSENDNIVVTVIDDGPGIPKGHEDLIFDPLFTTKRGNSGMGLSICVSILETLGGRIEAANEPGRGASFTVRLPRRMG